MIIDTLANHRLYSALTPRITAAFEFLMQADLPRISCGKHPIDGSSMFLLVQEYETRAKEECQWEAHRLYMDLQYIMKGTERMGYAPLARMTIDKSYSEEEDYLRLTGDGDFFDVHEGMFAIFMPNDVHMPGLKSAQPGPVRKLVLKILLELSAPPKTPVIR